MARDAKIMRLDSKAGVDRISNLPGNILDLILQRLPVQNAARTSILSKTWRYIWVVHPQLVFDEVFFLKLVSKMDKPAQVSEVSKTISNILLGHSGPILKFHLSIPQDLPLEQDTILWIKNISDKGVRELKLFNESQIFYKMPSHLFSCLELTHLSLSRCILTPPLGFGGFSNLISVKLLDVIITANISFGTQLSELVLTTCFGIGYLGCQFKCNSNLTVLMINRSIGVDWRWFECTQKVESLGLVSDGVAMFREKTINLDNLVGNMPRLYSLQLDGSFLKTLEPGAAIFERLTTMENLHSMHLYDVDFSDLVQSKYVLCLIRSSPKLQHLYIRLAPRVKCTNPMQALHRGLAGSLALQYLQLQNLIDMDQLETVEIEGVVGYETELQFIKLLLASFPLLRRMKFVNTTINDLKEELRISRELMRFPRASTTAQIIWA